MGSFWHFLLAMILAILWVIAGGYLTEANWFLRPYRNKDSHLHLAYRYTLYAALVVWILVGLFLLLVFFALFGFVEIFAATKEASTISKAGKRKGSSAGTILFLFFSLVMVTATGILAAICARNIAASPNYSSNNSKLAKAYHDCIIAAVMCLGAGGIAIIGIFAYLIAGRRNRNSPSKGN